MQRLRDISLSWRLTALYVAILATVLTVLGVMVYSRVESFLLRDTQQRLEASVRPPAGGPTRRTGDDSDTNRLADIARSIASSDTAVQVISLNGDIMATAQPYTGYPTPAAVDPQQVRQVLAGQKVSPQKITTANGQQLIVMQPLTNGDRTLGVVQLTKSLDAMDHLLSQLRLILLFGIVGAVLLGAFLGVPVTRYALRPLAHMTATSEQIAAGDLSQRTNLGGSRDEIGRLASAFDSMVDQLEEILRAQRQFIADASHELRTPLTALGGLIEMLLLGADRGDVATTQRALRLADREVERLSRLVGDLLTLSRLDAHPVLNRQSVDLAALVSDVGEQTQFFAGERTVTWQTESSLRIEGDADKLKQVLLNLTGNAVAFTPPNGAIALEAARRGQQVTITVRDNGAGIAAADLPRLFERFYRGDKSRVRRSDGGGNGLGLAIAKAIIEAHEGTIQATSTVGTGTTITITLPMTSAPVLAATAIPAISQQTTS